MKKFHFQTKRWQYGGDEGWGNRRRLERKRRIDESKKRAGKIPNNWIDDDRRRVDESKTVGAEMECESIGIRIETWAASAAGWKSMRTWRRGLFERLKDTAEKEREWKNEWVISKTLNISFVMVSEISANFYRLKVLNLAAYLKTHVSLNILWTLESSRSSPSSFST